MDTKTDFAPTVDPNTPPPCLGCVHHRYPVWMRADERASQPAMVAAYSRCARWRKKRDASLLLVVGVALERDEMVLCTDARAFPEMCGPEGRTREERT